MTAPPAAANQVRTTLPMLKAGTLDHLRAMEQRLFEALPPEIREEAAAEFLSTLEFKIPGPAVAKGRPRATSVGGHARVYTPATTTRFENLVKHCFVEQAEKWNLRRVAMGLEPIVFPVRGEFMVVVDITFGREIPKSMPKGMLDHAMRGVLRPTSRPDLDNTEKSVLDGLNKVAFDDDTQVVEKHTRKVYMQSPCTTVQLRFLRQPDPVVIERPAHPALAIPCPSCKAAVGEKCVNKAGEPAAPHAKRKRGVPA